MDRLGLQKGGGGYNFVGVYPTKGCYSYESGSFAKMAYYGVGGSEEQIKAKLTFPMYRPLGYDCITNGKHIFIVSIIFSITLIF